MYVYSVFVRVLSLLSVIYWLVTELWHSVFMFSLVYCEHMAGLVFLVPCALLSIV